MTTPATDEQLEGMWIDMSHSTGPIIMSLLLRIDADREKITLLTNEIADLRAKVEKHNLLCLADLGGEGVWPCGCHHLIVDSYGSRKPLTAADGEVHRECDAHAELRQEIAALKAKLAELGTGATVARAVIRPKCRPGSVRPVPPSDVPR